MRFRNLVLQQVSDPTLERVQAWIGHLASGEVADLMYRRFSRFAGDALVAHQRQDLVGLCAWQQDEGVGLLGPVIVREDKRGWGLAGQMVGQAIESMRESGVRVIESCFPCHDAASNRLFASVRFRTVGEERLEGVMWARAARVVKKS